MTEGLQAGSPTHLHRYRRVYVALVCLVLVGGLSISLYQYVRQHYSIRNIVLFGLDAAEAADIRSAMDLPDGMWLPTTDTALLEKKVLTVPYIRKAGVSKELPNTLLVEVEEREVGALLEVQVRRFLVATDGMVLEELEPDVERALPTIKNPPNIGVVTVGKFIDQALVDQALAQAATFQ